jgi:Niemann-Pick C1 protein
VENFLLALGAVFAAVMLLASPSTALFTTIMVACITLDIVGLMWVWNPPPGQTLGSLGAEMQFGVDINAVSVVNLVMAVGLSVEFCVHICTAFMKAVGTREQRAQHAVINMGSNVVTGITLTKLVGVLVLAWAPSKLFQLYYFRMYFAIIILGAFHGLMVLPVILSLVGPASSTQPATTASKQALLSSK